MEQEKKLDKKPHREQTYRQRNGNDNGNIMI